MAYDINPRFDYHIMSDESEELSKEIRIKASELENLYMKIPNSRTRSVALTDLESSVMWINKALSIANENDIS